MEGRKELAELVERALEEGTLVKLTLSEPEGALGGMRNVRARPVVLKEGPRLSVVEVYSTREVTRNMPWDEGVAFLGGVFAKGWRRAHVFTTAGDFELRRGRGGKVERRAHRATFTMAPDLRHDRVSGGDGGRGTERFLQRLGVSNAQGQPRPGMAGKLRQVGRFTELLGHLLEEWGWEAGGKEGEAVGGGRRVLRVADMGAGKGYLTFALARAFEKRGLPAEVVGVEQRGELVASCQAIAQELGVVGLRFEAGQIGQWQPGPEGLDVLVALHACNTATDDALFQGIEAGAGLLVTSPCCHHELRPQLSAGGVLGPVLRHGILRERQAEILTDTLRALLLELRGYAARVFEFVEPEHSGKNLMLAAIRRPGAGKRGSSGVRPAEVVRAEIQALREAFQIREQRLAILLGEEWR